MRILYNIYYYIRTIHIHTYIYIYDHCTYIPAWCTHTMRMLKKGLVYAKGKGFKNLQAAEQSKGMHLSSDCCSIWANTLFKKKKIYICYIIEIYRCTHTHYTLSIYIYTATNGVNGTAWIPVGWLYIGLKWGGQLRFFFIRYLFLLRNLSFPFFVLQRSRINKYRVIQQ